MSKLAKETNLSVVLPCLNEAETLGLVIDKAIHFLSQNTKNWEVIVADNGSTDGSQEIARLRGAKVIEVPIRGYGAALKAGIGAANFNFIVMGDSDDSYSLDQLHPFLEKLTEGYQLVMGDRFAGGIEVGAMPWLHKYLGNPVLSFLGRLLFKAPIHDFHCGLRAFQKDAIISLNLQSNGMEFASEMVVKSQLQKLKTTEVPTTLKQDGRSRPPHLRTWKDGWRHLIFLLTASPRWLFFYPGAALSSLGVFGVLFTTFGTGQIGRVFFELNTFLMSIGFTIVGVELILMSILVRIFSTRFGMLPATQNVSRFDRLFSLERGIVLGCTLLTTSLIGFLFLLSDWNGAGFDHLTTLNTFYISGAIILGSTIGIQILFASFFASMLQTF